VEMVTELLDHTDRTVSVVQNANKPTIEHIKSTLLEKPISAGEQLADPEHQSNAVLCICLWISGSTICRLDLRLSRLQWFKW